MIIRSSRAVTKKKRGNMTDGHVRQSMARDDTVGIIGFLQRNTEKERKERRKEMFLWQASVEKHFLLSARKRALSSGRLRTRRALAASHNNNNSRKDSAPESWILNLNRMATSTLRWSVKCLSFLYLGGPVLSPMFCLLDFTGSMNNFVVHRKCCFGAANFYFINH